MRALDPRSPSREDGPSRPRGRRVGAGLGLSLLVAGLSIAPEEPPAPNPIDALSRDYLEATRRTFELTWTYYSEARVGESEVYWWSRRLMTAQLDHSSSWDQAIAAYELHLEHMKRLEALVRRLRQIGRVTALDALEAENFRVEAELMLARANAERAAPPPAPQPP